MLGYLQDGPYDVQAARIRGEQRLRSPDIYGNGTVIREVFSIRALVRPGNWVDRWSTPTVRCSA